MKTKIDRKLARRVRRDRSAKVRYGIAAWLLGLPLPIIILAVLFRGCDW